MSGGNGPDMAHSRGASITLLANDTKLAPTLRLTTRMPLSLRQELDLRDMLSTFLEKENLL